MSVSLEELMESAASGVLRALHARGNGESTLAPESTDMQQLVQSGFAVEFNIRCGGRRFEEAAAAMLNPQPLPPFADKRFANV